MPQYVLGVLVELIEPISHGWANILDNYLADKFFNRLSTLIFLSTVASTVFLPIVLILDFPTLIPVNLLWIVLLVALIEIGYQYPYYQALRIQDTSIVASLFFLGSVFVPILAYFAIDEVLGAFQYLGFVLIISASFLLSFNIRKLALNKALLLMLVVSLLLSLQYVLLKMLFNTGITWGTALIWTFIFELCIATAIVLLPSNRAGLKSSYEKIRSTKYLFLLANGLGWTGGAANMFALTILPVSVTKGIACTQPFFVLVYAWLFSKRKPDLFREYLGKDGVTKKVFLFIVMILGTFLIIFGGSEI